MLFRSVGSGLTQEQLAEAADLNPRTVQKIEAGQINILVTTLVRIQSALNCTAGELFGEEGSPFLENSPPTSGAEPELTQQSKKQRPGKTTGGKSSGGDLRSAFIVQCGLPLDQELCHPSLQ